MQRHPCCFGESRSQNLKTLFPVLKNLDIYEVLARARTSANSIPPFDENVISFLDALSKRLFQESRQTPSLAPLAFFIRKAHSKKLGSDFAAKLSPGEFSVPQGLVFHIPPTNVDTLFLYTLSISLLAGNSNIVRISENSGPETFQILDVLFSTLEDFPDASSLISVVSFGRESEALVAISKSADVRMIWGGDQSIRSIREAPVGVHAKDLAFPDRYSFCIINTDEWQRTAIQDKLDFVESLYNDTYWFDQMACSSPQQLVLVSEDMEQSELVKIEILDLLNVYTQSRYENPEGQAINKMVAIVKAIGVGASGGMWNSNSLASVSGVSLPNSEFIRPGAGFFATQIVRNLSEILEQIQRNTQTISYFGFTKEDLQKFVEDLNGRGVDRIVPVGHALEFSTIWDGKDLLHELQRLVTVS